MKSIEQYQGFELGPIRPPSEARSLLLRVTRNCPWNRCTFCGLYKGQQFSVRPVEHVLQDIDTIKSCVDEIHRVFEQDQENGFQRVIALQKGRSENERMAFHAALNWIRGGMTSIFLQDANSLIVKPDHLVEILLHIRTSLPQVQRITTYARSHTIARISDQNMTRFAQAGLNRIHVGMESGSDAVLRFVKKGVTKETHITAGRKVKQAGIELSNYYMPGLGGEELWQENGLETADAMNQINPDFIRIRTLAIPDILELYKDCQSGSFTKIGDVQIAQELLLFFENLKGITSMVKSDHILNLFQESEGRLPVAIDQITAPLKKFLAMAPEKQMIYMVGRRSGIFSQLADMNDPELLSHTMHAIDRHRVTIENVDTFTAEMVTRFI